MNEPEERETAEDAWEYWHQRTRALEEVLAEVALRSRTQEEILTKIVSIAPRPWMCEVSASWSEWNEVLNRAERILKGAKHA